ncbi:MAG: hypothetical protein Q9M97_02335 [Candidatus Gracilibacteria bacterium]|nr:hypothetical protein [Candidatus Gracilibacteria bacterium]
MDFASALSRALDSGGKKVKVEKTLKGKEFLEDKNSTFNKNTILRLYQAIKEIGDDKSISFNNKNILIKTFLINIFDGNEFIKEYETKLDKYTDNTSSLVSQIVFDGDKINERKKMMKLFIGEIFSISESYDKNSQDGLFEKILEITKELYLKNLELNKNNLEKKIEPNELEKEKLIENINSIYKKVYFSKKNSLYDEMFDVSKGILVDKEGNDYIFKQISGDIGTFLIPHGISKSNQLKIYGIY